MILQGSSLALDDDVRGQAGEKRQYPGLLSGNLPVTGSPLENALMSLENTAGTKHMSHQTSSEGLGAPNEPNLRLSPAGSNA